MEPDTEELREIWWPSPEAFDDLTVEDAEHGFTLSAPEGTECAAWLDYYNQTDELLEQFNRAFTACLKQHLERLENGGQEQVPDGGEADREQAQEDVPGQLAQHEA